jgi:hypothetical protein
VVVPYHVDDLIYYLSLLLVCAVYDGGFGKPSEEQGVLTIGKPVKVRALKTKLSFFAPFRCLPAQ